MRPDFIQGMHEGAPWLGIPFITVKSYLGRPRWMRWTIFLAAAVLANGWGNENE